MDINQKDLESVTWCSTDTMDINQKELESVAGCSTDTIETIISRYLKSRKVIAKESETVCAPKSSKCDIVHESRTTKGIRNCIPIIKMIKVYKTRTASWSVYPNCVRCSNPITDHIAKCVLNTPIVRVLRKQRLAAMCHHDLFNINITQIHNIGQMNKKCPKCSALKFIGESAHMCCVNGAVDLPLYDCPVPEIVSLYSNKNFLLNIRAYNSIFAFTSLGATPTTNLKLDKNLANAKNGIYTFKIQGTICHRIGSLLPPDNSLQPQFAQIYIMDPSIDVRASRRCSIMEDLSPDIVKTIESVLAAHNPFAKSYSHVGLEINNNPDVVGLRIYESVKTDLRRYNKPTADEVAAVIIGELDAKPRDLIIYKRVGGMKRVFDTWPQYDPLQYPILFPSGELGWKIQLPYANGAKRNCKSNISTREFYAYRYVL